MSIEKINLDTLSVVEGLDTQPAVTGKELQKKFDEDSKILAGYINNNVIPVVNNNTSDISDLSKDIEKNSSDIEGLNNSVKNLNSSVSSINTNISNLIKTKSFSKSVSVGPKSNATDQFTVAMSGYKCLGPIAFNIAGTNSTNIFPHRMTASGIWAVGNCEAESAKVEIAITYLYVKS
ncbi:hypothetical protein [uncultured Anaerofustis sp.]|uniref:hypothetical protein n=1 Tax=uncultured Anaerofustis sp. TaxID=904996 RepID=UPI0025EA7636|nr:hypothetical protein [uncultured Anaerofustis sp.]